MRLLDITDDMDALDELLCENGGDITDPVVAAAVDKWTAELDGAFASKVDNMAALIQTMEARAEIRRDEAERLVVRAKADENSAAFLKSVLKNVFESRGRTKFETDRYRVSIVNNGGKQAVDVHVGTEELPDWAKRTKIIVDPDKDAIRAKLEAGEELTFAVLQPRGTRLSIK